MKDKKSSTKFKDKPSKNMDEKSKNGMEDIVADSRFSHIVSDPRYKNISSRKIKVQVDKRFKSALMDEKFNKKSVLDPRGKPKNYGTKEGLQRFYDMESSESDSEEDENEDSDNDSEVDDEIDEMQGNRKSIKDKKSKGKENKSCKEEFMATLLNPERDLARGDTFYSDDSSDDDSSTTDEDEEEVEHLKVFEWGELDHDAQWDAEGQEVEETSRFAVCCMDWDNVKAVDLLVLFSSFAPSGGVVKKVTIYPSDFGKARLKEEELKGPEELVKLTSLKKKRHNDEFSDLEKLKKGTLEETDKATALELEALRRYQRNRLKYYYAVVECDSVETSTNIYRECDRTHFEVIEITLDLRYIPSDMEFDEIPHDVCEKIPDSYESDNLQVSSLVQVKPTLTWDDTDRRRKNAIKNAMSKALKKENFNDNLLTDFVANSESEEEDEGEDEEESAASDEETEEGKQKKKNRIAKFRALISEIDEKESKKRELVFDMEETFDAAEEKRGDSDSDVNGGEVEIVDGGSEDVNKEEDEFKGLTPFERLLTRRTQRKKERKMRIKELKEKARTGGESDDESGIENHDDSPDEDAKAKKKKGRKKKTKSKESEQKMTEDDLALLVMNEEEEDKRHFDMKKIQEEKEKLEKKKRKRKNKDEKEEEEEKVDDFKVDVSDSRFSALFTHGSFNVDPSHPKYNKHSSLNQNIMQKQKKVKLNTEPVQQQVENNSKMDTDISDMIRRFRMKTSKLK